MFSKNSSWWTPGVVRGCAVAIGPFPRKAASWGSGDCRSRPLRITGVLVGLLAATIASNGHSQPPNPTAESDLHSATSSDAVANRELLPVLARIQKEELSDLYRVRAAKKETSDAGVELGTWYRIGPLRDQPPHLNWMENVASSFAHRYEVEKDLDEDGGVPRLAKTYRAANFPTTPDARRKWTAHADWIDGYLCDLPRGPAPSAGETQYICRTITAIRPITVELDFVVRSPESDRRIGAPNMEYWRRQARYWCKFNGKTVLTYDGREHRLPPAVKLELKPGENHFVAKITNNRHSYGFSFAIVGLHPAPERPGAHEYPWRPFQSYRAGDLPYFEVGDKPAWYVSDKIWLDSLWASAKAYRALSQRDIGPDIVLADFEGPDYGDWKVTGKAFGAAPATGPGPGQGNPHGFQGKGLANTFFKGNLTGTLTSPEFKIERSAIRFLIGGGRKPGTCCINLLVGGKVVRTATGKNDERVLWRHWDVTEFRGRKGVIEIVDNDPHGWGHINVDQITLGSRKGSAAPADSSVWAALRRQFTDPKSRIEIELTQGADVAFWDAYLPNGSRQEDEDVLTDYYVARLAAAASVPAGEVPRILNTSRAAADFARRVREAYFTVCRYREGLIRLKSFRHVHAPMPGIEAAAHDSRDQIVTQMEAQLEEYPESAAGRRHRKRVEALGAEIERLIEAMVVTGEPHVERVLALDGRIEKMWADEIRSLGPILFLERPMYYYDALQFTQDGAAPAYVRVFDPVSGAVRTVYHSPELRAHDLTLSWDAQTVFIGGDGNVAEVGVDGKGYRVITPGQSPAEMPDGRIVFFDDAPGISPCKATGVRRLLFTIHRDGTGRKVASANLTIDQTPQIADDGRVVFCRWDYGVNKNVFNRHAIWVQNPDGTGMDLFFGNTIIDPFGFYRPRQVPGRPEMVCIFGTHHNHNAGLVGLIWQGAGREGGDGAGFQRITHDMASAGDLCPHWAYQDPCPLNEQLFLVSYGGVQSRNVAIYLLDRFGNKKCLYEPAGRFGAYCPQPLAARPRPPIIPCRAATPDWRPADVHEQLLTDPDWSQKATLMLQDVYQGIEPEVERGRVKHLAVMEQVVHTTPRGGAIGLGTPFYVNRLIGLVPVQADGSARFEVPALRSLYFHVLDKDGKMLMTMGSDMHAMPGEHRGCVGCHEHRKNIAAPPGMADKLMAAQSPPVRPEMPDWGTNGILEYEAVVQPVLDKYCVKCHSGSKPKANLDLSGSRTTVFNMSYMQLVDRGLVNFVPGAGHTHAQPTNDYDEQAPLSRGALLSRITASLEDPKHSETNIPWVDRYRVYCWIDANVPFYSHYTQMSPTILKDNARKELSDVYKRRCNSCHDQRPRADAITWLSPHSIWVHRGPSPGQWGITESGMRVRHLNLTHPQHSLALQAPLAKSAGGLQLCVGKDGKPIFENKNDADYKLIQKALTEGIVLRDQPGVKELLRQRKAQVQQ